MANKSADNDVFVELTREKNGSVSLYFRSKRSKANGLAFFCLVRREHCGESSLFRKLASNPLKLKSFAVQSDAFFHTGNFLCGFATVQNAVGRIALQKIEANTPYKIAIAFSFETTAGGKSSMGPMGKSETTPVFTDEIQLRELKDKSQKLVTVFTVAGNSPWNAMVVPSINCVQLIALQYHQFLRRMAHNPTISMQHLLTIRGVSDPLCGQIVALAQTCGDIARKFGGVRDDVESGVLFEALAALGSATAHASLKGPWTVDWLDFLLLCTFDTKMFERLQQVVLQYKTWDMDGEPLRARIAWMVKPENVKIPGGSLIDRMEQLCPNFSPGRAIWALMPHRQQLRAIRYMYHSRDIEAAVEEARGRTLAQQDPGRVLKIVQMEQMYHRFDTWVGFVMWRRRVADIIAEKRRFVKELIEQAGASYNENNIRAVKRRFADWKFFAASHRVERTLQVANGNIIARRAWKKWEVFIKPTYRFPLVGVDMPDPLPSSITLIPSAMISSLDSTGLRGEHPIHPCYIGAKVLSRLGKKSRMTELVTDNSTLAPMPASTAAGMGVKSAKAARKQGAGRQRAMQFLFRHSVSAAGTATHIGLSPKDLLYFELRKITEFRLRQQYMRLWKGYEQSAKLTRVGYEEKAEMLSVLLTALKGGNRQYAFRRWRKWAEERLRETHKQSILKQ